MSKYIKIDDLRMHFKNLVLDGEKLDSRTVRLIITSLREIPIHEFDDEHVLNIVNTGRSDMKIRTLVTVRCPDCNRKLMEYIREHDQDPENWQSLTCDKCGRFFPRWDKAKITEEQYEV